MNNHQLKIPLSYKKLKIIFIFFILILLGISFYQGYQNEGINWGILREKSGELAWRLLIFIIFISLFSKIFPKIKIFQQFLPLRKEAGILAFLITVGHMIFHFLRLNILGDFSNMFFQLFQQNWVILLGSIALIIMIPLFFTSNIFSMKKMGYNSWKNLQRFTHLVFILAAIHVSFVKYPKYQEIKLGPLVVLTIYILGYSYLFLKNKKSESKKNI